MGYKSKREIMEALKGYQFSPSEVALLDNCITENNDKEAILDSHALNEIERNNLRDKFLEFCEREGVFFDWLNNAKKGID